MRRSGSWLHGFLDMCLLALLADREDYGFGLTQRLAGVGLGDVPGGTLYPALLRLERHGWVSVTWQPSDSGPPRKYFHLTPQGREVLIRDAAAWHRFRDSVDTVLDGAGTPDDESVAGQDGVAGSGNRR
jgi:PadR family transcriptional regulator PadR